MFSFLGTLGGVMVLVSLALASITSLVRSVMRMSEGSDRLVLFKRWLTQVRVKIQDCG